MHPEPSTTFQPFSTHSQPERPASANHRLNLSTNSSILSARDFEEDQQFSLSSVFNTAAPLSPGSNNNSNRSRSSQSRRTEVSTTPKRDETHGRSVKKNSTTAKNSVSTSAARSSTLSSSKNKSSKKAGRGATPAKGDDAVGEVVNGGMGGDMGADATIRLQAARLKVCLSLFPTLFSFFLRSLYFYCTQAMYDLACTCALLHTDILV